MTPLSMISLVYHKELTSLFHSPCLRIQLLCTGSHFFAGSSVLLYHFRKLLYSRVDLFDALSLFLARSRNFINQLRRTLHLG